MKVYYFLLIIFLFSCKTKDKATPITKNDSAQQKIDTFNLRDLMRDPSLQEDIGLNELVLTDRSGDSNIVEYPKVSASELPDVKKKMDSFLKEEIIYMKETLKENPAAKDKSRWSVSLSPVCLYKDDRQLSFAFISWEGYTATSAGWDFTAINFDVKKNKQIFLGDYFILATPEDSMYLGELISRVTQRKHALNEYILINGDDMFCFDKENVYFLFEKYNVRGVPGAWSVRKEFILDHINPSYR